MNNKSSQIKKVASIVGLLLGAFSLSVLAADWTPPECPPPGCNTEAPINVGNIFQNRTASLAILNGLSLGKNTAPGTFGGTTLNLDVVGAGKVESLYTTSFYTGTLKVGGTDNNRANYVLTNSGDGTALWKSITSIINESPTTNAVVDITTWPRAWYIPMSRGENTSIPMRKIDRPNTNGTYTTQHDMGGCPPKAVMVGFDKTGPGNVSLLCAAPTSADLPDTFNWNSVI